MNINRNEDSNNSVSASHTRWMHLSEKINFK